MVIKSRNLRNKSRTKFLAKIVVSFILIFAILSFVLPRFIPLEKIISIPTVNDLIKSQTGLNLSIQGKARISIIPFLGFTAHDIYLTNDNFAEKDVVFASKIDIKISAFALLRGNIAIKNIIIDNAKINIIQCKEAINIFNPPKSHKKAHSNDSKSSSPSKFSVTDLSLSKFTIKNSNFKYSICNSNTIYNLKNINATIVIPNSSSPIHADISSLFNGQKIDISVKSSNIKEILESKQGNLNVIIKTDVGIIKASGDYKIDEKSPTFLSNANFKIEGNNILPAKILSLLQTKSAPKYAIPAVNFNIEAEVHKDNVSFKELKIISADSSIVGENIQVSAKNLNNIESFSGSGRVITTISNIEDIVKMFEINIPNVKQYPAKILIPVDFSLNKGNLTINPSTFILIDEDKLNIDGHINFINSPLDISLNIESTSINVDKYLNFSSSKPEDEEQQKASSSTKNQYIIENLSKDKIRLFPTENFQLKINLDIKKLIVQNLNISSLLSTTTVSGKSIANNSSLSIFGGQITSSLNVKQNNSIMQHISLNTSMKNVQIADIIPYFNLPSLAEGNINSDISLQANASSLYEIAKSGIAKINANSQNLTIKGINIQSIISDAKSDYTKIIKKESVMQYISPSQKSSIDSISIQGVLQNGIFTNTVLKASKDTLNINGNGTLNLLNNQISYKININNNKEPLPSFIVNGTLGDISYKIDPKNYLTYHAKKTLKKELSTNPLIQEKLSEFNNILSKFKK